MLNILEINFFIRAYLVYFKTNPSNGWDVETKIHVVLRRKSEKIHIHYFLRHFLDSESFSSLKYIFMYVLMDRRIGVSEQPMKHDKTSIFDKSDEAKVMEGTSIPSVGHRHIFVKIKFLRSKTDKRSKKAKQAKEDNEHCFSSHNLSFAHFTFQQRSISFEPSWVRSFRPFVDSF